MARLSISDAARVAGVARSTLHRAIRAGRLSPTPDGQIDTAELLRAGYTLQRSTPHHTGEALQDAPPRTSDALQARIPLETLALTEVHQERDLLRLERDLLRRELEAAQIREQAAVAREQDAREERLALREREALLLRMLHEGQQRYDRLLDVPRPTLPVPPAPASDARPELTRTGSGTGPRGEMRRQIVAVLREYPAGLSPSEVRRHLGADKPLGNTLLAMQRDGLVQRVAYGRYVVASGRTSSGITSTPIGT